MCLAIIALDAHPRYRLVVAANRDEYYARAAAPAAWGDAPPFVGILAGRDLVAGGTWLGTTRAGHWALVTNVRDARVTQDPSARSRGELVPQVLANPQMDATRLTAMMDDASRYNGFNLLAGTADAAWWMSNRSEAVMPLARGVHALSNAQLDTPWPKVRRTRERLAAWIASGSADTAPLFTALADRAVAPDAELPATGVTLERERMLSPPFIVSEQYGTRCSTVLTIDRGGNARFHERTFAANGAALGEVENEFAVA